MRAVLRGLAVSALVIAIAVGLAFANLDRVQNAMAHWTGESTLSEQIKGTVALVILRLTQPPPRTAPYAPMPHTGIAPYGVNTFLEQEPDPLRVEQSIALVSEAGFRWIRQQFPWEDIEISGKGDYWDYKWNHSAWDKYDRIVDLADAYGVEIIARLDNPPAWTRSVGDAEGWTMAPPDDLGDYGDFVYAVVSRYRGRVRYFQIWNEPNIFPEWGDQPADPAGYVDLLRVAYHRAKEANPDCVIIAAGLAQTTEETPPEFGPRNMSDLLYLQKMYEAGVKGHFDILGCQVYGLWTGPYDRRASRDRTNFARVELLREIMVDNGDTATPVWATEVGWNAIPEDHPAVPAYGRVSEETQAVYAIEAYRRARSEWPWMGVMNYWFLRRPSDTEQDQAWYYFRLLEPDFTPLPAFESLAWLARQTPTVQVGFHQEDHWALHYEGNWERVSAQGAILGAYALGANGDSVSFQARGDALALVLHGNGGQEPAEIIVDDRSVRPRWLKVAPGSQEPVLLVSRRLGSDPVTVRIRTGAEPLALDGLIVWDQKPYWALYLPMAVFAMVVMAALGFRRR